MGGRLSGAAAVALLAATGACEFTLGPSELDRCARAVDSYFNRRNDPGLHDHGVVYYNILFENVCDEPLTVRVSSTLFVDGVPVEHNTAALQALLGRDHADGPRSGDLPHNQEWLCFGSQDGRDGSGTQAIKFGDCSFPEHQYVQGDIDVQWAWTACHLGGRRCRYPEYP
ncbi:MAG: hypothetical protein J4F37_02735 [Acidobacteria bacterium]|nr:hypothetical protein [Acidobacteriota bacterium]